MQYLRYIFHKHGCDINNERETQNFNLDAVLKSVGKINLLTLSITDLFHLFAAVN